MPIVIGREPLVPVVTLRIYSGSCDGTVYHLPLVRRTWASRSTQLLPIADDSAYNWIRFEVCASRSSVQEYELSTLLSLSVPYIVF
jgi:hypothetical protein